MINLAVQFKSSLAAAMISAAAQAKLVVFGPQEILTMFGEKGKVPNTLSNYFRSRDPSKLRKFRPHSIWSIPCKYGFKLEAPTPLKAILLNFYLRLPFVTELELLGQNTRITFNTSFRLARFSSIKPIWTAATKCPWKLARLNQKVKTFKTLQSLPNSLNLSKMHLQQRLSLLTEETARLSLKLETLKGLERPSS